MKATVEQLANIQFLQWDHDGWVASFTNGGSVPVSLCRIEKGRCIVMADARLGEGTLSWSIYGGSAGTVRDVLSKIDNLTGWMTRELAALDLAEKRERMKPAPGEEWEYCSEEDATEWTCGAPYNPGFWCSRWERIKTIPCDADRAEEAQFIFRRPKKAAERAGNVGEGYEPCEPKDATECRLYGDWKPVAERECEPVHHFQWRRPKKSAPKLPTVKAPDGLKWGELHGVVGLVKSDGSSMVFRCIANKYERDGRAACVAAFDEASKSGTTGTKPLELVDFLSFLIQNPGEHRFMDLKKGTLYDWKFSYELGMFMSREVGIGRWLTRAQWFGEDWVAVEREDQK